MGTPTLLYMKFVSFLHRQQKLIYLFFAQNVQYFCKKFQFTPQKLISFPIKLQMFGFDFRFLYVA